MLLHLLLLLRLRFKLLLLLLLLLLPKLQETPRKTIKAYVASAAAAGNLAP